MVIGVRGSVRVPRCQLLGFDLLPETVCLPADLSAIAECGHVRVSLGPHLIAAGPVSRSFVSLGRRVMEPVNLTVEVIWPGYAAAGPVMFDLIVSLRRPEFGQWQHTAVSCLVAQAVEDVPDPQSDPELRLGNRFVARWLRDSNWAIECRGWVYSEIQKPAGWRRCFQVRLGRLYVRFTYGRKVRTEKPEGF